MRLAFVTEPVADTDGACARCADLSNFNSSGVCVCTPDCGYCGAADGDYPLNLTQTGVACVDLGAVVDGTVSEATMIPDTGAVAQGAGRPDSPECAYGFTYRNHKRGGRFDASVSDFPTSSVVLVDMATQEKHCQVSIPGKPFRVVYVPRTPQMVEGIGPVDNNESSTPAGSSTSDAQGRAGISLQLATALLLLWTMTKQV
jgi:hypothetical protein